MYIYIYINIYIFMYIYIWISHHFMDKSPNMSKDIPVNMHPYKVRPSSYVCCFIPINSSTLPSYVRQLSYRKPGLHPVSSIAVWIHQVEDMHIARGSSAQKPMQQDTLWGWHDHFCMRCACVVQMGAHPTCLKSCACLAAHGGFHAFRENWGI